MLNWTRQEQTIWRNLSGKFTLKQTGANYLTELYRQKLSLVHPFPLNSIIILRENFKWLHKEHSCKVMTSNVLANFFSCWQVMFQQIFSLAEIWVSVLTLDFCWRELCQIIISAKIYTSVQSDLRLWFGHYSEIWMVVTCDKFCPVETTPFFSCTFFNNLSQC